MGRYRIPTRLKPYGPSSLSRESRLARSPTPQPHHHHHHQQQQEESPHHLAEKKDGDDVKALEQQAKNAGSCNGFCAEKEKKNKKKNENKKARGHVPLSLAERRRLWGIIKSKPTDPRVVAEATDLVRKCGALDRSVEKARSVVEEAWEDLSSIIESSYYKIMLRAFGNFVLERHY
uniref:Uncharacterized protein n=1 Tax=Lotharella globosa TaxID=91324 RepID=A0A7S3YQ76_9EUKA